MVNLPSLTSHTRLEQLYLNDNKLGAIPKGYFDGLHTLRVLSLGNNTLNGTIETMLGTMWSSLRVLNVSNNPDLASGCDSTWPGLPDLEVLDITSTRILVTTHMCTSGINIFASNTPQLKPYEALQVLQLCSKRARLLDTSNNNASLLEAGLSDSYEVLDSGEKKMPSSPLAFRLQTSDSPVKCSLLQGLRYVNFDGHASSKTNVASHRMPEISSSSSKMTPVLQYRCSAPPDTSKTTTECAFCSGDRHV